MTIDLAFARHIVAHPYGFDWTLQGFGMFRLYLSPELRLHVWSPSHAIPNVTMLHTHPWHFESHILQGEMRDRSYRVVSPNEYPANQEPMTHRERRIRCGPGGCDTGEARDVCLLAVDDRRFGAGGIYRRRATSLHESEPTPGCITVIRRTFLADTEHALVYCTLGEPWVSAEPRPATRMEIEEMREVALTAVQGEG